MTWRIAHIMWPTKPEEIHPWRQRSPVKSGTEELNNPDFPTWFFLLFDMLLPLFSRFLSYLMSETCKNLYWIFFHRSFWCHWLLDWICKSDWYAFFYIWHPIDLEFDITLHSAFWHPFDLEFDITLNSAFWDFLFLIKARGNIIDI